MIVLLTGAKFARQDSGHVSVVVNSGPLDNRRIRQFIMPGQRVTWTGMYSQSPREYPASTVALTYTITSDARRGERDGLDVVNVPSRDGVRVGLEGTVFFHFVAEQDLRLLRQFHRKFGLRTFPVASTDQRLHPWHGDDGFRAMLDATFRPVLDANMREEVGAFRCAELVASCSLVRRVTKETRSSRALASRNIKATEARIERSLRADLTRTLGGEYFRDIRVRIARVTLPGNVQHAVDGVQASTLRSTALGPRSAAPRTRRGATGGWRGC